MYLLGYDIGSSSVKASLVNGETGKCVAAAFYPEREAPIMANRPGWGEQHPEDWWAYLKWATRSVLADSGAKGEEIDAIGISFQMHGLVSVDRRRQVLRPSIIWCDSRVVSYGEEAFRVLGKERCLSHLLRSGEFYRFEAGMGEGERTRDLRTDRQDHAARRLHRDETDRRALYDGGRSLGRNVLELQKE